MSGNQGIAAERPSVLSKAATIDGSASDETVVAAVSGKKIRVTSVFLMSGGTVNVKFQSTTATDLTGQINLVANTGFVLPHNPDGWFETADGELLNFERSGVVQVGGALKYVEVG